MKTLLYENETVEAYNRALADSKEVSLAFALITESGFKLMEDGLKKFLVRGGQLKFLVGVDMPSDPRVIEKLLQLQRRFKEAFKLKVYQSGERRIFHPKMGIFSGSRRSAAILGSSNLTAGGLMNNVEANVLLDDKKAIKDLNDFFFEVFEGGRSNPVTDRWLVDYTKYWEEIKKLERKRNELRKRFTQLKVKETAGTTSIPNRVKGNRFAFTGKFEAGPQHELIAKVVDKGGTVARKADSMKAVNALVHGNILGGRSTTRKLSEAKRRNIPVITEDVFDAVIVKEKLARARKR